jgi:hypothetical protein
VLGVRAGLPAGGDGRRGIGMPQVVPDLFQQIICGIEAGHFRAWLEMVRQNGYR